MAQKPSTVPPQYSVPTTQDQYPEAPPPSYEASVSGQVQGGAAYAGGFKTPPQAAPDPRHYNRQGYAEAPPVIVTYVAEPTFGPHPANLTCPHCQANIRTSTDSEPGPMAWILAGMLCVMGLWPCACIPCCIDSLSSVTHRCPRCNNTLGRYKGGL